MIPVDTVDLTTCSMDASVSEADVEAPSESTVEVSRSLAAAEDPMLEQMDLNIP